MKNEAQKKDLTVPHTPIEREIKVPRDSNPDAITGAPGSHPVGAGVGAATAGVAGAVIGSVVPGVGTLIGGAAGIVVGAVFGGLAGKGIAEVMDPTVEETYWRNTYRSRPYYQDGYSFDDDYAPAYMYGYTVRTTNKGKLYDDLTDADLRAGWDKIKAKSRLSYGDAKAVARDAWLRQASVKR